MRHDTQRVRQPAFTLVELLVVISIIALLISLLLPSLKRARDQAKAVKCGAQIHGLGSGLLTYGIENDEWLPGRNTTGLETWIAATPASGATQRLSRPHVPVQTYDWMTPILRVSTTLPANRAERFRLLLEHYRCPSVNFKATLYSAPPAPPDNATFQLDTQQHGAYYGVSYLMPAYFQLWGTLDADEPVGFHPLAPTTIALRVDTPSPTWEVTMDRYRSRINKVGTPAEKIAAADGTRYLDERNELDFDHAPNPSYFGAFTSSGGWWRGSVAYGVYPYNKSRGKNIPLSYRHQGGIESLFFDGHVAFLTEHASRKIDYWYPRGAVVAKAEEGIDAVFDYPNGYTIR
ncbi:MAG TPA: prepilin-type N-terminal cleavage/methylation domain-containing protein [Phycisphaerae bacterium]|nr:prepilin-type N-terminal cleavage/methylation domain-containing protein [Phycisphaerae bacterium]